jgi:hypothetical protein
MASVEIPDLQRVALERLISVAEGDTGQSCRVANFLLAWWNAEENGGFDLTDLWNVDDAIRADMVTVFDLIATTRIYPDRLGYEGPFTRILAMWRLRGELHGESAKKTPVSVLSHEG